ncbi:MAG: TonB-dependent receptor plug domain-containing protein [Bacteroidota bacterium]
MKYFIPILVFLTMQNTYSQTLEGTVIDEDGIPLEDVGVFNKNNGEHSHTDGNGNFSLPQTSVNDTVYFSRLGHTSYSLMILKKNLENPVTVTLQRTSVSLEQVVLVSKVDALSRIVAADIQVNPVKSSQEILRKVPGLFIGQHAGGGKAEQIFLRGFDVDHGTDVAISVDGMPVNMVSHAHGQGYADLHFVIPETLKNIKFGKGPYYANQGDFNTAGFVDLKLKKQIDNSLISSELGQFGTQRFVGMFNLLEEEKSSAYIASELYVTDGPFESPQNFNRFNLMGRYLFSLPGDQELSMTASHFQSKWDASGQIPQRAVDQGVIGRFGAIDDTEGGQTSRTNLTVNHSKQINEGQTLETSAYVSRYDFDLFSNFTFFLEDPENGDQIRQFEERLLMGANTVWENDNISLGKLDFDYKAGIGFRYDNVDNNQLSRTLNRQSVLERLAFGDVDQVNTYGFVSADYKSGDFTFNPVLRLDYFNFDYANKLSETYDNQSEEKVAFSPKFNTIYNPTPGAQFFLKTGIGFHSNDARVVTSNGGEKTLPAAYGVDLGTILKPTDGLVVNATLWSLFSEQEFVYVGDAGIVEPSGRTRRLGFELGARYQATDWLYMYADANYTHARSVEEQEGMDFIPLAPKLTSIGGLVIDGKRGFSGGINYRYIDDRPANEDNSIIAEGYLVADANLNYNFRNWTVSLMVENIFDTAWNETQFATESRLFNESSPVEEIHFTPGSPFYIRGKISVRF